VNELDEQCGKAVISLDDIRREFKVSPTDDQGYIANIAREQAKDYLRKHQSFVWNATNITAQMRESLISLFETYHAHVRIVYLETEWQTLMERNHNREHKVPEPVIEKMLGKLAPPDPMRQELLNGSLFNDSSLFTFLSISV